MLQVFASLQMYFDIVPQWMHKAFETAKGEINVQIKDQATLCLRFLKSYQFVLERMTQVWTCIVGQIADETW